MNLYQLYKYIDEHKNDIRPGKIVGKAMLQIIERKGIITRAQITSTIESLEMAKINLFGADLVVRAWIDDQFKVKLLADGMFYYAPYLRAVNLYYTPFYS